MSLALLRLRTAALNAGFHTTGSHVASHLSRSLFKPASSGFSLLSRNKKFAQFAGLGVACCAAQHCLGKADDFFDHRFVTTKKPEDLVDFYGTEDFMEIFCVLPFMVQLMMRGGTFDDEGHVHTWGLTGPGELEISIEFDEPEDDTTGNDKGDTVAWFNKRENFKDVSPLFGGTTLWEMTQNFGYKRLEDGSCEVYHHGEHFEGLFPVRLIFQIHSMYVFWATKRYVNSDAFGSEDHEDEAEVLRQNIPLHAFKEFLVNLTYKVERAKEESQSQSFPTTGHDETIQKLKEATDKHHGATLPHFRTLRRRHTSMQQIHLVVEDEDTQEAIRSAMSHICEAKGMRSEPVDALDQLRKHATDSGPSSWNSED